MLSIKEISEKFRISKSTLYGWETDRPELFNYLQNANSSVEQLRDITIILDKFSQTIKAEFVYEELEFLLLLQLNISTVKNIENFHMIYIEQVIREIKDKSSFVMPIYTKLEKLNLVEKYIFSMRYKELQKKLNKTKEDKVTIIQHYFKPFIVV